MLRRWLRYLPAGILLAAVVLALVWLARPRSFGEVISLEPAAEYSILATDTGETWEAWPSQAEMESLLELLREGTLRLDGRSRSLAWGTEETMYRLYFYDEAGLPEDFYLCTDGTVHIWHERLDFVHYQLNGCDMAALEAELSRLLGMV